MSRQKSERLQTLERFRESVKYPGSLRIHLMHSRSNMSTVARMWHPDGYVIGRARGCGYARGGAALGEALTSLFPKEIETLSRWMVAHKQPTHRADCECHLLSGLVVRDGIKPYLEGAAGIPSMLEILRAIGFRHVECYETGERSQMVLALREMGK